MHVCGMGLLFEMNNKLDQEFKIVTKVWLKQQPFLVNFYIKKSPVNSSKTTQKKHLTLSILHSDFFSKSWRTTFGGGPYLKKVLALIRI